jgi:hypothetical protein
MALDTEEEAVTRALDGLDDSIFATRGLYEAGCKGTHGLMMKAIGRQWVGSDYLGETSTN